MPDRPPRIPREEPESDPPPRGGRDEFVRRSEMERYVSQLFAPMMASLQRIETEAVAARRDRDKRKEWEAEKREEEQFEAVREKTKSETDLFKAQAEALRLQRPATPLVVPIQVTQPVHDSDPLIGKSKTRWMRWVVVLTPILVAIIVAVSAIVSNRVNPHGAPAPATTQGH